MKTVRRQSVREPRGFTLVELLVVIAIIGILVALLLPAIQAAREAARRAQCASNLKNIALAIHNHHDAKGTFPPGAVKSSAEGTQGDYFTGWTREIMPYAEDQALRDLYDPSIPIHVTGDARRDPLVARAQEFRETFVPLFQCASDFAPELARPHSGPGNNSYFMTGSYRANAGRGDGFTTWYLYEEIPPGDGSFSPRGTGLHKGWRGPIHAVSTNPPTDNRHALREERMKDITDGTSKTLLVGESTNEWEDPAANGERRRRTFWAYTWGNYIMSQPTPQPRTFHRHYFDCRDLGESSTPNTPTTGQSFRTCMSTWYGLHPGGFNGQMCDGSGRFISSDIDLNVFAAMGSIAGGEDEATGI